jgi:hypothetical protein
LKEIVEKMMKGFSDPLLTVSMGNEFLLSFPIIKPRFEKVLAIFDELAEFLTAIIDDHIKQNDYTNEIEPQV